MLNIILISLGGAIGSALRYISFHLIIHSQFFRAQLFPWATFFVNILGSLLAGVLYYFTIKYFENFDVRLKNFLLLGVLGGFTTFSAFSLDFFRLFSAGQNQMAFIYAISSVVISILALFGGFYLTKFLFS